MSLFTKIRDISTGKSALNITQKAAKAVAGMSRKGISKTNPLLSRALETKFGQKVAGASAPLASKTAVGKILLDKEKK